MPSRRDGVAVVLLDGDARVLGERLLELGDARLKFLLVRCGLRPTTMRIGATQA